MKPQISPCSLSVSCVGWFDVLTDVETENSSFFPLSGYSESVPQFGGLRAAVSPRSDLS